MGYNILLCGIGGQGTVLAAKLLSMCAMRKGLNVLSAETIGMAQKGGGVVSHVRIGDGVFSPLIPKGQADMIIAFEASECVRNMDYLKSGGCVIVNRSVVPSVDSMFKKISICTLDECLEYIKKKTDKITAVDAMSICRECGSYKVLNMALLGYALNEGIPYICKQDLINTVKENTREAFFAANERALMCSDR